MKTVAILFLAALALGACVNPQAKTANPYNSTAPGAH